MSNFNKKNILHYDNQFNENSHNNTLFNLSSWENFLYNNSYLSEEADSLLKNQKYEGMFHNIPFHPKDLIKVLESECFTELASLKNEYPKLKCHNTFDLLLTLSDDLLVPFPKLITAKKKLIIIAKQLEINFRLYIEARLHQGHQLADAHMLAIQAFLDNMGFYGECSFKEIYQDNVDQNNAEKVLYSLRLVSRLIPHSYKKNIPELILCIKDGNNDSASSVYINNQTTILSLNIRNNLVAQLSEAFHEYMHLVEKFNPELMVASNKFLLKRRFNNQLISLEDVSKKYLKQVRTNAYNITVYEGVFIDPYAGKTYGELDPQLKNLVSTELLTVGAESLLLNPVAFLIRDPEHFELISNILQAKI